jgi:hypothetical protein
MFASERRTTCRRKLHLPLRFHRQDALIEAANGATCGEKASNRLFTGRVTRMGVHLLYYVLEFGREQANDVALEVRR